MKKRILSCILIAILSMGTTVAAFDDIADSKAKYEINYLANEGIIKGVSDNKFAPSDNVTRAEFAALVARALKLPEVDYTGGFADVSSSDWFAKSVASASKYGYINGFNGKFNPNDNITNEEACKILVCAYEQQAEPIYSPLAYNTVLTDFFDVSQWARVYVSKAEIIGLLSYKVEGKAIKMFPTEFCTRETAAWSLYNTLNAINTVNKRIKAEEDE